jgi:hypothetical protein
VSHPAAVPWLKHLRTDRRGLPVPYVNAWGTHDLETEARRLAVRRDPWLGVDGVFLDDADQDVPDFTRQNMGRQREVMLRGLCQVCGRHVPWSRRWLVVAGMSVEVIDYEGRQVPVVFEPWLDRRCLDLALKYCPALIRRTREEELHPVEVTSKRQVLQFTSVGWVEGELEEQTKANPPAMWVKLALLHVPLTLVKAPRP